MKNTPSMHTMWTGSHSWTKWYNRVNTELKNILLTSNLLMKEIFENMEWSEWLPVVSRPCRWVGLFVWLSCVSASLCSVISSTGFVATGSWFGLRSTDKFEMGEGPDVDINVDVCDVCCLCVKVWDDCRCCTEVFDDDEKDCYFGFGCLTCIIAVLCWPLILIICMCSAISWIWGKCCSSCSTCRTTRGSEDSNNRHQVAEPVWTWKDLVNKLDHGFLPSFHSIMWISSIISYFFLDLIILTSQPRFL